MRRSPSGVGDIVREGAGFVDEEINVEWFVEGRRRSAISRIVRNRTIMMIRGMNSYETHIVVAT